MGLKVNGDDLVAELTPTSKHSSGLLYTELLPLLLISHAADNMTWTGKGETASLARSEVTIIILHVTSIHYTRLYSNVP